VRILAFGVTAKFFTEFGQQNLTWMDDDHRTNSWLNRDSSALLRALGRYCATAVSTPEKPPPAVTKASARYERGS